MDARRVQSGGFTPPRAPGPMTLHPFETAILSGVNIAVLCTLLLALDAAVPSTGAPDAGASPATVTIQKPALVAKRWQAQRESAAGPALAIGTCSRGCLQGAATLSASGTGYEVLHLARNRHHGHPTLIAYVRRLAAAAKAAKLGLLIVGDLSQPRGGPTPTGHRSHQTGLDADIGYVAPAGVRAGHLSSRDRERMSPPAVVDLQTHRMTPAWRPRTPELLALAAKDPTVDRIFVNPAIKQLLCDGKTAKSAWQARVRPWWGHHDHFHVRLKCPADSAPCIPQDPPSDDGCGATLAWWFTPDAEATRARRKDVEGLEAEPELPTACEEVIAPPQRSPGP